MSLEVIKAVYREDEQISRGRQSSWQELGGGAQPHSAPAHSPAEEKGAPLAAVVTLPQILRPLVTYSLTLEHQLD